jgi:HEAT repeats
MKRARLICITLVALLVAILVWFAPAITPTTTERYQGLTASQWESEIRRWEVGPVILHGGTADAFWVRHQPFWNSWLKYVGIKPGEVCHDMPLLHGDPDAVPVLAELLASHDPQARRLAAQGLEKVGEKARSTVPDLIRALDDEDQFVRQWAEQALWNIDEKAAERAAFERTMFGPWRRGR